MQPVTTIFITPDDVQHIYHLLVIPDVGDVLDWGFDNIKGTVAKRTWTRTNEVHIVVK